MTPRVLSILSTLALLVSSAPASAVTVTGANAYLPIDNLAVWGANGVQNNGAIYGSVGTQRHVTVNGGAQVNGSVYTNTLTNNGSITNTIYQTTAPNQWSLLPTGQTWPVGSGNPGSFQLNNGNHTFSAGQTYNFNNFTANGGTSVTLDLRGSGNLVIDVMGSFQMNADNVYLQLADDKIWSMSQIWNNGALRSAADMALVWDAVDRVQTVVWNGGNFTINGGSSWFGQVVVALDNNAAPGLAVATLGTASSSGSDAQDNSMHIGQILAHGDVTVNGGARVVYQYTPYLPTAPGGGTPVPEPATLALAGLGATALARRVRGRAE